MEYILSQIPNNNRLKSGTKFDIIIIIKAATSCEVSDKRALAKVTLNF